jgi:hypothetical protein
LYNYFFVPDIIVSDLFDVDESQSIETFSNLQATFRIPFFTFVYMNLFFTKVDLFSMDGVEFCKIEPPSPGKFLEIQVVRADSYTVYSY